MIGRGAGGAGCAPRALLRIARLAGLRCMRWCPRRQRRSWNSSRSGGPLIAVPASSPTAAPMRGSCGCRRRRCGAFWLLTCLVLPEAPARRPAPRAAWPAWLQWEPNKIWCWDITHFPAADRAAFAIVDVVSRRWIDTHLSIEETSTQVKILFDRALAAEGLVELITPERVEAFAADATQPILLAASDNGPQMTSHATREFFAALAVAQRLGRPGAPTDQAWIESLFGHVKGEWPHLESITDPARLDAELDRVRRDYNGTRLHAGIGYVTPDDEHAGRGEAIRQARIEGLQRAHRQRIDYHRNNHKTKPQNPTQVG